MDSPTTDSRKRKRKRTFPARRRNPNHERAAGRDEPLVARQEAVGQREAAKGAASGRDSGPEDESLVDVVVLRKTEDGKHEFERNDDLVVGCDPLHLSSGKNKKERKTDTKTQTERQRDREIARKRQRDRSRGTESKKDRGI